MGDFRVRKINDAHDRRKMYQHALNDVEAFEMMIKGGMFDTGPAMIGAEQELCVVDKYCDPGTNALKLLDEIDDPHYTNELALFNLEINSDPSLLSGDCFGDMEKHLLELLEKGKLKASDQNSYILLAGILPTLKYRHLQFEFMTPIQRYKTLSKSLSDIRGRDFEIHLEGVDEVIMSLGSVLFEACNTSFQLHLQIHPDEFVDQHNWSQMISGPVLSACVNSPLLFGNELWAETRIALFKQSLDTRSSKKFLRKKLPRVYFGGDWLRESPAELWKNDIMRFPLLVTSDDLEDSKAVLQAGKIPNLRGIRLHNGTTYTWNRMCYGFSEKLPHLRIECRYLPSGPTLVDEIANFAFWIGLMNSTPKQGKDFWKRTDFRLAKNNFIKSARTGLSTVINWFGKNVPAKALILEELLPMAQKGLEEKNVAEKDISKYLGIIEDRVEAEATGADWQVKNFRILTKRFGEYIAQKELVRLMLHYQSENIPVTEWKNFDANHYPLSENQSRTVEQIMTRDLLSVHEHDSIELVKRIMKWNNIHHLPVESQKGNLVGMITDGMIKRLTDERAKEVLFARDIMLNYPVTVQAHSSVQKAVQIMEENRLSGLPVVFKKKLVGIITERDLDLKKRNIIRASSISQDPESFL